MGIKRETWYRKFEYRVAERQRIDNTGVIKNRRWGVERRTIIFGIPFWWKFSWEKNEFDSVNLNNREFSCYKSAFRELKRQCTERSYARIIKIKTKPCSKGE